MLRFFRKMGQALIPEGRLSQYFLYAIGEIVLVVIGILIALQINNWNEARKNRSTEIKYLERLKSDLIADTVYLDNRIDRTENSIRNHYTFIQSIYQKQKNQEEFKSILKLLTYDTEHLIYQNSAYIELVNAGQLNIISNDHLRQEIISLYRDYEISASHIKEINEFTTREFSKVVQFHAKYHNPNLFDQPEMLFKEDWEHINDPSSEKFKLIEGTVAVYQHKYGVYLNYFDELKQNAIRLIQIIDSELNNKK